MMTVVLDMQKGGELRKAADELVKFLEQIPEEQRKTLRARVIIEDVKKAK